MHTSNLRSSDVAPVRHMVSIRERAAANGHAGGILWMTGLSGAGKSTLAVELERGLFGRGYQVFLLDGDNIRQKLSADLGFSPEDRTENIRRVGEVAALFAEAGVIAITALISPYRADRDRIRSVHRNVFHEIYVNAPLEVCEARDVKGLYRKARSGELKAFTGVSDRYEPPSAPELELKTHLHSVDKCLAALADYVGANFNSSEERAGLVRSAGST